MTVRCAWESTFKSCIWVWDIVNPVSVTRLFDVWGYTIALGYRPRIFRRFYWFLCKDTMRYRSGGVVRAMSTYVVCSS